MCSLATMGRYRTHLGSAFDPAAGAARERVRCKMPTYGTYQVVFETHLGSARRASGRARNGDAARSSGK